MLQNHFQSTRFILVAPRMAANVGSAARAMKTMGFTQLCLVRPFNFDLDHLDAVALASGADDVLKNARVYASLDEALTGCSQVVAMTARPREWGGVLVQLPEQTVNAVETLNQDAHIAYVFGNERFGLSNEDVQRCGVVCTIDVNPDYGSLNLAQAVQVVAYAQRIAINASKTQAAPTLNRELSSETPAQFEQLQGLQAHWLEILEKVGLYNPQTPRRLRERLGSIWGRASLTTSDVDMLRGIASAIDKIVTKKTL